MKRAAYSVERLQEGMSRITVTPDTQLHGVLLLALLPLQVVVLVGLAVWFGAVGVGVWFIQVLLTWLLLTRLGAWNRGRFRSVLHVGPVGVQRDGNPALHWADIERVQMVAPYAGGVAMTASGPGLVPLIDAPVAGESYGLIAERSWRVEVISERHVRLLSGGLTEPIARGVLFEIAKRYQSRGRD